MQYVLHSSSTTILRLPGQQFCKQLRNYVNEPNKTNTMHYEADYAVVFIEDMSSPHHTGHRI